MKQSRKMSLYESLANVAVGFAIQCIAQFYLFLAHGLTLTVHSTLVFGALMTVLSVARSYGLRRAFEEIRLRQQANQVRP